MSSHNVGHWPDREPRRFGCLAGTSTNQVRLSVIRERIGDNENAEGRKQRANNYRQSFFATIQALAGERPSIRVSGDAARGSEPAPPIALHSG
jgi:hypothetical protein